jgi:hypothetical protein
MSQYGNAWRDYKPPVRGGSAAAPKRSKYGAVPHVVFNTGLIVPAAEAPAKGGRRFDSKREAERFWSLRMELEQKRISDLEPQKQYPLHVVDHAGVRHVIGRYIADFAYTRAGKSVVEDAKGVRTELYKWKKKHVEAEYGVVVVEV